MRSIEMKSFVPTGSVKAIPQRDFLRPVAPASELPFERESVSVAGYCNGRARSTDTGEEKKNEKGRNLERLFQPRAVKLTYFDTVT
jgi:hypothetical protein